MPHLQAGLGTNFGLELLQQLDQVSGMSHAFYELCPCAFHDVWLHALKAAATICQHDT